MPNPHVKYEQQEIRPTRPNNHYSGPVGIDRKQRPKNDRVRPIKPKR